MQDWLAARAQASPDKIAIIEHFDDETRSTITYQHLHQRVDQFCYQLQDAGVQSGQHVAMLMMNSTLAIVPFFAALRMGLVFVPLNTRLTVDELDFQIQQADVDWVLPYGTTDQLAGLRDKGHQIVVFPRKQKANKKPYPQREIDLDAPFFIVHTSGTSGKPKGAMLSYGNVFHSALASAYRIGHQPDDIWLCVLPLYHVGGLSILVRAVLYGITVDLRQTFDVEAINHALTHQPITLISLVPTMLYRLLEIRQGEWHPALRLVLLGGAAATSDLMQTCIDNHIPVASTYGLSEAASQVATTLSGDAVRKAGTVGKPLLFTQVKIVDEAGNPQASGEYGEILVKGLTVMQGYYNNPEATAKTIQDGWLHTGDIGYLDAEGDLFLVQRRSDLIVTGGENVYPAEVEAVLRQMPAIAQIAVVGISDAEWGQKVAAAIVLADQQTVSEHDISDFARQHLAGYKIPRVIRFVDALPLTASGKIQRGAVQALFEETS
ncbi:MAG: o-succinylbenzoate--CoA ligase [Phototrophicaceae bacterium]